MRAFVAGGADFIGSHLVELLADFGYQVTCTVRKTSNLRWLQRFLDGGSPQIQLVTADLVNPDLPIPSLRGVDIVFHLAGLTKAINADEYDWANARATKRLIEACLAEDCGITRFLYCSSLATSGSSPDGKQISEDMPPQPLTDYGKSKLMGETIAREYVDRLSITIIRPRFTDFATASRQKRKLAIVPNFRSKRESKRPPVGTQITAGFDLMLRPSLNLRNEWNADLRSLNRVQMRTT